MYTTIWLTQEASWFCAKETKTISYPAGRDESCIHCIQIRAVTPGEQAGGFGEVRVGLVGWVGDDGWHCVADRHLPVGQMTTAGIMNRSAEGVWCPLLEWGPRPLMVSCGRDKK